MEKDPGRIGWTRRPNPFISLRLTCRARKVKAAAIKPYVDTNYVEIEVLREFSEIQHANLHWLLHSLT